MKVWTVADVMTRDVATVRRDTPYRDIVDVLTARRISAVPVVDDWDRVVGVVSQADLLHKIEVEGHPGARPVWESRRHRSSRVKAEALLARDLMTAPAVTALPDTPIAAAARRMDAAQVKRLPVTDDLGRLVGVVTRGDLLRVHLRPDAEIRRDVVEGVLRRVLAVRDGIVRVEVRDGVVTLTGDLDRRTTAATAARLAGAVAGVVAVQDRLGFDLDDTALLGIATRGG